MKKLFLTLLLLCPLSLQAGLFTVNFGCITDNSSVNCALGESSLSAEILDESATNVNAGQIGFAFNNDSLLDTGDDAVIQAIYFDDTGLLDSLSGIFSNPSLPGNNKLNVAFAEGGSPPNLPGGNQPGVNFDDDFRVSADNPAPFNGLGGLDGEFLEIVFNLATGEDAASVIAALQDGSLRIGLHVISFPSDGESESFVTTVVPVPAAFWLFASALGFMGIRSRKK